MVCSVGLGRTVSWSGTDDETVIVLSGSISTRAAVVCMVRTMMLYVYYIAMFQLYLEAVCPVYNTGRRREYEN